MEEFPENFCKDKLKKSILDKDTVYGSAQHTLLANLRKEIVTHVIESVERGERSISIRVPPALCFDMNIKLATELLERFPGGLLFYGVEGDSYHLMKSPCASLIYKILL